MRRRRVALKAHLVKSSYTVQSLVTLIEVKHIVPQYYPSLEVHLELVMLKLAFTIAVYQLHILYQQCVDTKSLKVSFLV